MNRLAAYRKAIVGLVGSVLTWAGAAYIPDGHVSRAEWYVLAVALATAGGIYVAPNTPATPVAITTDPTQEPTA